MSGYLAPDKGPISREKGTSLQGKKEKGTSKNFKGRRSYRVVK